MKITTMKITTRFLVQGALIAAVYAVVTILWPISSGQIQVRISEALTVLPALTPAAIPGLFIGCLVSNFVSGGLGPLDYIGGSIITLLAALLSRRLCKYKLLVPLPPVILNGLFVGFELHYLVGAPMLVTMGYVAAGELIACYLLGFPLLKLLDGIKDKVFKT